jgi:perosamine synthetase
MSDDPRDLFRRRIGETIGVSPDAVFLFAKGRVALYAILRSLDVGPGDEVILPAFTCVAVPNAILYTGATPIYVDIDPTTLTIDPVQVEAAVGPRTRAIIAQNTFGLSSDLDRLAEIGAVHGARIIDDCTHGLGGSYRGRPNGASASTSFFSTQWSKTISTGLGGFAVARDDATAMRLRELEEAASEPSAASVVLLRALVFGMAHGGHGAVFRTGRSAYRALSRHGLVPSSSSQVELETATMPESFVTQLSPWQAAYGADRITRLRTEVARRRAIAGQYSRWLSDRGRSIPAEPDGTVHAFLRYPIKVTRRDAFIADAERTGVDLGDWFVSPIHPVVEGLERWGYEAGRAPHAERACSMIVNLPIMPTLRDHEVERVIAFLADHVDQIE